MITCFYKYLSKVQKFYVGYFIKKNSCKNYYIFLFQTFTYSQEHFSLPDQVRHCIQESRLLLCVLQHCLDSSTVYVQSAVHMMCEV
jgi:hypothetical protein